MSEVEKIAQESAIARQSPITGDFAGSVLATLREPLLVLDAAMGVVTANPAFYRVFQVSPAETIGRSFFELGNRQWDLPRLRELLGSILPQDTHFDDFEVAHEFEHIGSRTMLLHARRIQSSAAGARLILLGIEDDTARLQALERVAAQAALLDHAHDAILVKDLEDRIAYWNKGAERIYGWTAAEVAGRPSCEIFQHEPTILQATLAPLMQKGEWRGEMVRTAKDGRTMTVEARCTLLRDEQGRPRAILDIATDITEKRQIEDQYLRAQRMESIGTLAGGIAHDLNNVFAPIVMSIEMLKSHVQSETGLNVLATLQSSARRGSDLVRQVVAFARGVEGRRVALNPVHVLRDIEKFVQDTFPKTIDFKLERNRKLWTVTGDPTQLHQVFMNLCVNARDAMPKGGQLTVTLENVVLDEVFAGLHPDAFPGTYVLATVTDTGTGIPAAVRNRIFEPFFTTKEVGQGTGLGLSTALAIVKSHGGFLTVSSEPGKGAQFKVYLPADTTTAAQENIAQQQTRLPRGNGELVLVVDDEEGVRIVAKKTLEHFGYRVLLAVHGAEAVALYAQHRDEIGAVLTDMAMPVMDGPATVIALTAMNPRVKIIGSSGLSSTGGVGKAANAGVRHFVPKPYTAETLLVTLRRVLDEPVEPVAG